MEEAPEPLFCDRKRLGRKALQAQTTRMKKKRETNGEVAEVNLSTLAQPHPSHTQELPEYETTSRWPA